MKKWRAALGALALLGWVPIVCAEPTPLVSKFMNEPVSLFSLGMYRLNANVSDNAKNAGFSFGTAVYDWPSNQIQITAGAFFPTSELVQKCSDAQACEKGLREAVGKFANNYAMKFPDGTWMQLVTGNFTPDGYTQKQFYNGKSTEQAAQDLVGIVKITGTVSAKGAFYECRRDLQSTEIFCSTKPAK